MRIDYDKSNGELEIKLRKKWNDNFRIHDLSESINDHINNKTIDDRKSLVDKYSIRKINDISYTIDLNNGVTIKINKTGDYNMFSSYNDI
jgi:hypothetical protein